MVAIIKMILPTLLSLIGYFIEKGIKDDKQKAEARREYSSFLSKIEPSFADSSRIRSSIKNQRRELLKKIIQE